MEVDGTTAMRLLLIAGGLLGREDDVAVVGQKDDLVDAQRLHRLEQLSRAGVHGLAAVDDGVTAKLTEEPLVAVPGDHRDHHRGRGVRGRAQPFVAGLGLLVHVVDLDLADRAVPESFAQDGARVIGVNVDLHEAIVADDEGAVADRPPGTPRTRRGRRPRP